MSPTVLLGLGCAQELAGPGKVFAKLDLFAEGCERAPVDPSDELAEATVGIPGQWNVGPVSVHSPPAPSRPASAALGLGSDPAATVAKEPGRRPGGSHLTHGDELQWTCGINR